MSSPQIVNSGKNNYFQYRKLKLYLCTNLMILLKGNVRYRSAKLDILSGVIPCRIKTGGFFFA